MANSKRRLAVPGSVRDFVERQATAPLERLFEDRGQSVYPYAEYWQRAVAAMLLSGRVAAKADGFPNMTDVNRISKEANFDQYRFQATGGFLATAEIIQANEQRSGYEPGQFSEGIPRSGGAEGLPPYQARIESTQLCSALEGTRVSSHPIAGLG
jgi:hypothetical protein